jgi:hypothetical protein
MRFGFDTGYFVKYATGDLPDRARQALQTVADGTAEGVASAIVIYEIQKLGLRGVLDAEDADSPKRSGVPARSNGTSQTNFLTKPLACRTETGYRW